MAGNFLFVHVNEWADFESCDAIPLSQGYILANLKKYGYSGTIIGDYKNRPLQPRLFNSLIQDMKPNAIGFSVYEENINKVRAWARLAKNINPDTIIVFGGPQTTFMPVDALKQMDEVDVLCRGEGESVMVDLADALSRCSGLSEVSGICYRENGSFIETGRGPYSENLDDLPSPYLQDSLDFAGKSRVILLSSRGCTSPCTFCYTPRANGKRVRFHSVDRIIEEMQFLYKYGISDFWFADPNFAYSRKRLETFLETIIRKVPGITFWCQTRYNLVDTELLDLLKRAGAHTVAFGLESAHDDTLKRIKKGLDLSRMSKAIRATQDAGIHVELFTLFGLPGESLDDAQKTLDFVKRHNVDVEGNSISQQLHVFFGTPISENPAQHGVTPLPRTKPAYQSICRDFATDGMTAEEIRQMGFLWRLNRKDFAEDIKNGVNLFRIAGFITSTSNKSVFNCRPEAAIMLAEIYLYLDELGPAAACLNHLRHNFSHVPEAAAILGRPFIRYTTKRRAIAQQGCRIIFDCKGLLNGDVIAETVSYFTMATLGSKVLIADFEKGIEGIKAGSATQFDAVFPEDYGSKKLAGKKITFQVYLHQVLEPVVCSNVEQVEKEAPKSMYRFDDLFSLQKYNENLYYMVLRDSILHSYTGNLPHMIALVDYYLKLGFKEKALELAYSLPQESSVMAHIGKMLLVNELPEEALEFLQQVKETNAEIENKRLKAYMKIKQYEKAEEIGADPRLATNLETMSARVNLAHLQQLPLEQYLQRLDALLDTQVKMMAARC